MGKFIVRKDILKKSLLKGVIALSVLLSVYFLVLTFVSGWNFAWLQFTLFWYYIVTLALGFGIQFTFYSYLKDVVKQLSTGRVLATTGATSTAAMISCCAHYLTNILPILGVTGIIAFIGQYQVQFFWIGLLFNFLGMLYTGDKVLKVSKRA